jgi:hypothetical protein
MVSGARQRLAETTKVNTVLILPAGIVITHPLSSYPKDATMDVIEREEILCPICCLSVVLGVELHTDEEGRAIHEACYVKKIAMLGKRAVPRYYGESKFDCFA